MLTPSSTVFTSATHKKAQKKFDLKSCGQEQVFDESIDIIERIRDLTCPYSVAFREVAAAGTITAAAGQITIPTFVLSRSRTDDANLPILFSSVVQ